jgi:cytosine/uracil/thiamine/allantoin permease
VKPLHFLYDYAWFVGFFTAGILYVGLMRLAPPTGGVSAELIPAGAEDGSR